MNNTTAIHRSDSATDWQQVVMDPAKRVYNVSGKKLTSIRVFSIASIILGILSIVLQVSSLVFSIYYPLSTVGHGIWCGCIYVTAGSLGVAACKNMTISLSIGALVMSALSIAGSIIASILSGTTASRGVYYDCTYHPLCHGWIGVQWGLMVVSILAFSTSINLALAFGPLCRDMVMGNQGIRKDTDNLLKNVTVLVGHNQQPTYFQLQPACVATQQQQQQQTDVKFAYSGEQTQHSQQLMNPQHSQRFLYPQLQEFQFLQSVPNLQIAPQLTQYAPMVHSQQPTWPQKDSVSH